MGAHQALTLLANAAEDVRKAAAMLSADEVWTASNGDLSRVLREAERLSSATEAVRLCAVREADVRGMAAGDGQVSTAAWLGKKLTLHPGEAKARVKAAAMLTTKAPATMAKLVAGKLNPDQARAIARGLGKIEPHASAGEFAEAEAFLLREGVGLHAGHITRLARHIEAVLDPDGDPERAEKALRSRGLTITDLGCGRHRISGTLTDEGAAMLKAALDPLAAPRPAADGERDPRTPAQRNHDALLELCSQFLRWGELPKTRGARPHVHITASHRNLSGRWRAPVRADRDRGRPRPRDVATVGLRCRDHPDPGEHPRGAAGGRARVPDRDPGPVGRPGRPRHRVHRRGLHPPGVLVRSPPLPRMATRRAHRHRQDGPGLQTRALPGPPRRLGSADGRRWPPRNDPAALGRPRTTPDGATPTGNSSATASRPTPTTATNPTAAPDRPAAPRAPGL